MTDIECCVCLDTIDNEINIIDCERCVNVICINCFEKIEKKIDNNYLLCYTCPSCKLDIKLNLQDHDIIKKYNILTFFKKLIIFQNNSLSNLQITNNILQNKVEYLLFCGNNCYKVIKTLYILDKMFTVFLIGLLYLLF